MFLHEAVILAGGLGTRLKEAVPDLPKTMAPVNDRPFLEYLLDYLERNNINHVVLAVGYKHEVIMEHFGDRYKSVKISYSVEDSPLGTGGAIKKALKCVEGDSTFVFNGDTMFRVDLTEYFNFHQGCQAGFSLVLREVKNVDRYGAVEQNEDKRIISFLEKGIKKGKGYINGGIYLMNKKFFDPYNFPDKFSLEKDVFEKMVDTIPFYGFLCKQYFLDIGIPKDYQKAQNDFKRFED